MPGMNSEYSDGKPLAGIEKYKRVLFGELIDRTQWFIRLRWFVPPVIALTVTVGRLAGVTIFLLPFFLIALFIFAYNLIFHLIGQRSRPALTDRRDYILKFNRFQFTLDYIAIFMLIHFTGGMASPLIFLFFFHIISASILLTPGSAYGFATLGVAGMIAIYLAEASGWLPSHPLSFGENAFAVAQLPVQAALILIFFAASIYFTVFFTTSIVFTIRQRISKLVQLTEAVRRLNERLNSLYSMTEAIGSVKDLKTVFDRVTSELCQVMGVLGISVKLLSEDGRLLQYAAAAGLVADVFKSKVIEVAKSPLNRDIINGKPFVTGCVKPGEMMFQFGEDLAAANIRSVLFVPLVVENKVIGIVGAYCRHAERFSAEEVDFFRRAAGLVAVAIENARSYEAIEKLMNERNRFMMHVSHNLRSPLAAMISMLDVVRGGYQGELNAQQSEYLRRTDRRARTMIRMINELLILSKSREDHPEQAFLTLDLLIIAGRIRRTFQDEARQKGLRFEIIVPESLPPIQGSADMIEQAFENLVSNAIKYTESGGIVKVEFLEGPGQTVQIQISDTGIGIPEEARKHLFTEFFRAENARAMDEIGTGLGLTIVKQTVLRHNGRIIVESTPGQGTLFVVSFPVAINGGHT